jgi:hypothetical protein
MRILDTLVYQLNEGIWILGLTIEHIVRHDKGPFDRWIVTSGPYLVDTKPCSDLSA